MNTYYTTRDFEFVHARPVVLLDEALAHCLDEVLVIQPMRKWTQLNIAGYSMNYLKAFSISLPM